MKATELMICDWVNSDFGIFQIKEIFEDAVRDSRGNDYEFDCIHPILLTGEILKDNGFAFDEIDGSYRHTDLGLWIGGRHEPFGCMISNIYVELNYVHELQHALRMCKTEKEIELCQH